MGYKGTIPFIFIAVIKLFGQTEQANEMQEIRSDGQIETIYFEFKPIHVTVFSIANILIMRSMNYITQIFY